MKIKSEVIENKKQPQQYPFIGICGSGAVVLFDSFGSGTALASPGGLYKAGCYLQSWHMDSFQPLDGSITLSNTHE